LLPSTGNICERIWLKEETAINTDGEHQDKINIHKILQKHTHV
jgi:hypothetical protein